MRVLGIGQRAVMQAVGSDIVALGDLSASAVTLGTNSIFIGSGSGAGAGQKADVVNVIVIGKGVDAANDNEIILGSASNDNFTVCGESFSKTRLQDLNTLASNATELNSLAANANELNDLAANAADLLALLAA